MGFERVGKTGIIRRSSVRLIVVSSRAIDPYQSHNQEAGNERRPISPPSVFLPPIFLSTLPAPSLADKLTLLLTFVDKRLNPCSGMNQESAFGIGGDFGSKA